jgi:hypothetical protein
MMIIDDEVRQVKVRGGKCQFCIRPFSRNEQVTERHEIKQRWSEMTVLVYPETRQRFHEACYRHIAPPTEHP